MAGKFKNLKEPPQEIYDISNNTKYLRGKFLGKGGFARCYELKECEKGCVFAGKIISKSLLKENHQRKKMNQEVEIHSNLNHKNIVNIFQFFEDVDHIYLVLELCSNKTLMELHLRRKIVTDPEARYFIKQVVDGVAYLHERGIIHRDLKLGNLFLSDMMDVKIGDFGLATIIQSSDERRKTFCGTPNYIAPEVLTKTGHSLEVDIWAIGCVLYTLLVGKPPFETSNIKETYTRIKNNQFSIPSNINDNAKHLIRFLLHPNPSSRPRVRDTLKFDFFKRGFMPSRLPISCLSITPKFTTSSNDKEKNLNIEIQQIVDHRKQTLSYQCGLKNTDLEDNECNQLEILYEQLDDFLSKDFREVSETTMDEALHPASAPIYFISKWVDYSNKYGLGYQLSDNSVGILFNDDSKITLDAAGEQLQYCDSSNCEQYFTTKNYPEYMTKKVTILKCCKRYMREKLCRAVAVLPKEGDELARLPVLKTWFRTQVAIVLYLSNGSLQVNFFKNHFKVILCPHMHAISIIDSNKTLKTYKLDLILDVGCHPNILSRLKYVKSMISQMINSKHNK
uniref:Serine/threonine-protein kinase PLK n=1 Tax=Parastrongyloides trichosuri TaxID=131310 RepID=A0A0N4ZTF7_PARTI